MSKIVRAIDIVLGNDPDWTPSVPQDFIDKMNAMTRKSRNDFLSKVLVIGIYIGGLVLPFWLQ